MTKQETVTISKDEYDEMMKYIKVGSVSIEEYTQAINNHLKTLEEHNGEITRHTETINTLSEQFKILNNIVEQECMNMTRKMNNVKGGFSKYSKNIKLGINYKLQPTIIVKFKTKNDIDHGEALIDIIDLIERFGEK